MPWGGHKQEKIYFTATEESQGEVRVGGHREAVPLPRQVGWQEAGRLEHRRGEHIPYADDVV